MQKLSDRTSLQRRDTVLMTSAMWHSGGWDWRSGPRLTPALTLRAWSLSSIWPKSLPLACAIRFPETRFPTITEAGPISGKKQWLT